MEGQYIWLCTYYSLKWTPNNYNCGLQRKSILKSLGWRYWKTYSIHCQSQESWIRLCPFTSSASQIIVSSYSLWQSSKELTKVSQMILFRETKLTYIKVLVSTSPVTKMFFTPLNYFLNKMVILYSNTYVLIEVNLNPHSYLLFQGAKIVQYFVH